MNGKELRSFSHSKNFDLDCIPRPEQKSSNWLILKFVFIHCEGQKVSQNDHTQM